MVEVREFGSRLLWALVAIGMVGCGAVEGAQELEDVAPLGDMAVSEQALTNTYRRQSLPWYAPLSYVGDFYIFDGTGLVGRSKPNIVTGYPDFAWDYCKPNNNDRRFSVFQFQDGTYQLCRPGDVYEDIFEKVTKDGVLTQERRFRASCLITQSDTARGLVFFTKGSNLGATYFPYNTSLTPIQTGPFFRVEVVPPEASAKGSLLRVRMASYFDGLYVTRDARLKTDLISVDGKVGGLNQQWLVEAVSDDALKNNDICTRIANRVK